MMRTIIRYSLGVSLLFFQHTYAQDTSDWEWGLEGNSGTNASTHFIGTADRQSFVFKTGGTEVMRLGTDGKLGIGTQNTSACSDCNQFRLFVRDGIKTEKIKVNIASDKRWADHVLKEEYKLVPLEEVEQHIKAQGHLPNIPSAEEVVKNGIDLGEMNARLLEKIEELTLHTINLNKKNKNLIREGEGLEHMINLQDQEIDRIAERIDRLEQRKTHR